MLPQIEDYSFHDRPPGGAPGAEYEACNIRVLRDDENLREVLLVNDALIAKAYVLLMKSKNWAQCKEICEADEAIRNGASIYDAFRSRGFEIQKNVLDVYLIKIPVWLQVAFKNNGVRAKARTREFIVKKPGLSYHYGVVTEIYSPGFSRAELNTIDWKHINFPSLELLKLGFSKEEMWTSLEYNSTVSPLANLYSPFILGIKEKLNSVMSAALPF